MGTAIIMAATMKPTTIMMAIMMAIMIMMTTKQKSMVRASTMLPQKSRNALKSS